MTSGISQFSPIQFYPGQWIDAVVPLFKTKPNIQCELKRLRALHVSRMEEVLKPDLGPDDLKVQLDLEDHIARVRCREFHWLKDHFSNFDLSTLSLAIAKELFPSKEWEIVDGEDDEAVVTDRKRSIVFDFVHAESLSGLGSLALCGDPKAIEDLRALDEVTRFREKQQAKLIESLDTLESYIERFSKNGEVIRFPEG